MKVLRAYVLLLMVAACARHQAPNANTVTIALDVPPGNLDPRIGIDATSQRLFPLIFSSLVKTNDKYEIEPDLADRWETPDPLTYIFHLRTDAKFHNGKPVTARDVIYTYKTMTDGGIKTTRAGTYRLVQSVEAPDDQTVIFKLKQPFAPLLWNLIADVFGIIPEGSGADFAHHMIGSGPFKFVRYVQDSEVVLERNNEYFGSKAGVQNIRFKIIPEAIVRALELRKGSVDLAINSLSPDMVEVFRHDPELNVMTANGTNYQYVAFNLQDPVFRDLRVRQAIAHAINRVQIIKYVLRDEARLATGVVPPNNWAYDPDVQTYGFDPGKARQLLNEAHVPNLSFTYRSSTTDESRMLAQVLQQQFKNVGIHMEIRSNESATFFADLQKGDFQAYSARWIGGNNDPDMFDLIFESKRVPPNGSNRGRYSNPLVDRLIELGRNETDMTKRREAYSEIQRIAAEELPYVSLWYNDNVAVFNKRIQGVKLSPPGGYQFLTQITTDSHLAMR